MTMVHIILGLINFFFPQGDEDLEELCFDYTSKGYRILVLAHTNKIINNESLPSDLKPCGIYFKRCHNEMMLKKLCAILNHKALNLKIISGDDPITVSAIAKRAGFKKQALYRCNKIDDSERYSKSS